MATIASAVNTAFTPAVGDFRIQVTAGDVVLESRGTAGAPWAPCGPRISGVLVVDNPVGGVDYRFTSASQVTAVQADQ